MLPSEEAACWLHLYIQAKMDEGYPPGSLLMDAPAHNSVEELIELAQDKVEWNLWVNALIGKWARCKEHSNQTEQQQNRIIVIII